MSQLLVIESSARHEGSISRQLTQDFIAQWQAQQPQAHVVVRDVAKHPLPHLDGDLLAGWMLPKAEQTAAQQAAAQRSDQAIEQLLAADVLLLAAPMYNFSIPSTLKAWFDHVLRAGVTFKYTEQGPQGLLSGKRAVVLTARGGVHAGLSSDHQEAYLRQVLGFMGIDDVQFVHAEGLNMGQDSATQGLNKAQQALARVA